MCLGTKQISNYVSVLEKWNFQCGREKGSNRCEMDNVIKIDKAPVILGLNWKNQCELMIIFILEEK